MRLDRLRWTEVSERAGSSILAVPVGSTEQHGPHLPLSTDTAISLELCDRLAAVRGDVLVAPPVAYGSAGEHAGFAGTLSIGAAATEQVLVELGRSADAFAGVVFVSTHGGNAGPVRAAVGLLVSESRRVRAWGPGASGASGGASGVPGSSGSSVGLVEPGGPGGAGGPGGPGGPGGRSFDAHAGFTETSVLLALGPELVDLPAAAAGRTEPVAALMPALRAGGVRTVSPNGVLGDPTGASAAVGDEILAAWTTHLVASLEGWP